MRDREDAYGRLEEIRDTEDVDGFCSAVEAIFLEHPPLSRYYSYGSAASSKILEHILDMDIHPQSRVAAFLQKVIDAVTYATIQRLADELDWTEEEKDRAEDLMRTRRRWHKCLGDNCQARIPVRHWFCKDCRLELDNHRLKA